MANLVLSCLAAAAVLTACEGSPSPAGRSESLPPPPNNGNGISDPRCLKDKALLLRLGERRGVLTDRLNASRGTRRDFLVNIRGTHSLIEAIEDRSFGPTIRPLADRSATYLQRIAKATHDELSAVSQGERDAAYVRVTDAETDFFSEVAAVDRVLCGSQTNDDA